ncbi:glycosyltransferase family 39 protein [Desulfobulbus sp.]|uniref:ArnT family glycosyltransferase n=1 Tax=Desulfobulbus sp. TaxID=895 RepID=UPI0027BA668C|nr:phospholipid carrier-dependent glycosyltransferase [Desulfobulbus sp.]
MKLPEKALTWGLILLLLALIIATIILGSVPPVDRDALTHHLFVPKLWLKHGGIYEIPEIPFSYYPMNLDLLYTIPLYFGNDIIPKYIHYFFALLTGLLLYRHLKKRLGVHYGLLGALFFLSVPIIVKLSITVYVDLGVVFFTTASLLLLLHWSEQNFKWRSLVLAGLCCGLAAGTKYNGLISIVVLTLFVPIIYQQNTRKEKQSNGKALLWGCVFGMAALTSFSPWLIRNYAWTGNPIYPLHNSLFQKLHQSNDNQQGTDSASLANTLQQISHQGSNAFVGRKILYNESWWQSLLLPFRFFYEGKDDDPRYFDGKLTPFLLVLPALAFLFRPPGAQQRREQNFLLSFALLYFFLTFFQEAMRIRYIVPIVPPLVILSMYGVHSLLNKIRLSSRTAILRITAIIFSAVCLPGFMLWYNGQYITNQFFAVNPLSYLQGKVSRDEYITTFRPEYLAIQWLNKHTTMNNRVLCIFLGNRGYYMNFSPIFLNPYDGPFPTHANNNKYIITRDDMFLNWLEYANKKNIINDLPIRRENLLYSINGHSIYRSDDTAR